MNPRIFAGWSGLIWLFANQSCAVIPVQVVPITGRHGMVAAGHPQAAEAGIAILEAGGNAIDAAVAVSFALGVAEPYASGIGGKLNLVYFDAATGQSFAIDGFDCAGGSLRPATYRRLGRDAHAYGWTSVCVPGQVDGMALAHRRWGRKPWSEDLKPAIALARDGFLVLPKTRQLFHEREAVLRRFGEIGRIYLPGGALPAAGSVLRSPDLARSMELIAADGRGAFYEGPLAAAIVRASQAAGGHLTAADFRSYHARFTDPVQVEAFGCGLVGGGPPSDGAAMVFSILKALDSHRWEPGPLRSPANLDAVGRVWREVEPVVSRSVGDVPGAARAVARILGNDFIAQVRQAAGIDGARPLLALPRDEADSADGSTTHFVVVDAQGNIVTATQSLSLHFGSGMVAPGTGIILNDTMADFGYTVTGAVNFVAPGKRPRSTTCPAIVFRDHRPVLAIGLPGAGRIPTAMLQVLLDYLAFHRPLAEAIGDTRLHLLAPTSAAPANNVWECESSLPDSVAQGLKARGWTVVRKERAGTGEYFGGFNAVEIAPDGTKTGYADPRRTNVAAGY